jgi:hypothetical protein
VIPRDAVRQGADARLESMDHWPRIPLPGRPI